MTRILRLSLALCFLHLGALVASNGAMAGSIRWYSTVAEGYDLGVAQKKPIVLFLYDKTTGRVSADTWSTRLSLSTKIQAIAGTAIWCYGDVASEIAARNIAKALDVKSFPAISVMEPNGNMLDESARIINLGSANAGDQEVENFLVSRIGGVAAKYPARR